jgi:hypothetical protein
MKQLISVSMITWKERIASLEVCSYVFSWGGKTDAQNDLSFPSFPNTIGFGPQTANRELKGDRQPLPRQNHCQLKPAAVATVAFECANKRFATVYGRCLV